MEKFDIAELRSDEKRLYVGSWTKYHYEDILGKSVLIVEEDSNGEFHEWIYNEVGQLIMDCRYNISDYIKIGEKKNG